MGRYLDDPLWLGCVRELAEVVESLSCASPWEVNNGIGYSEEFDVEE